MDITFSISINQSQLQAYDHAIAADRAASDSPSEAVLRPELQSRLIFDPLISHIFIVTMTDRPVLAAAPSLPRLNTKENTPLPRQPPPPPNPASDVAVVPEIVSPIDEKRTLASKDTEIDIFAISPTTILKMLCASLEALVLITGDIPPTPPVSLSSTFKMGDMQEEIPSAPKESDVALAGSGKSYDPPSAIPSDDIEGAAFERTTVGSPEPGANHLPTLIGANAESEAVQQSTIARKFYSKKPPPIPLEEYLLRLHRYCPMSTAVFLAASLYIHRMTVVERLLPVTGRNVHRLLLAALRVAMKALEDLSYPHSRFAKVGGVTELELGRLEVSFCFLAKFELKVSKEMLLQQAISLRIASLQRDPIMFQPQLPLGRKKP